MHIYKVLFVVFRGLCGRHERRQENEQNRIRKWL